MKSAEKKARDYAEQSGAEFISAAQKSDRENVGCSPELRAIKRLAAILGAWVNEPRTDEAWRFYQVYDSPCTNRRLHCSSDIQKTCIKLVYAGKGDFADEIKDDWQRIKEYTYTADDNISILRQQYRQGGISKKVFAERVKSAADRPRGLVACLQGKLEQIKTPEPKTLMVVSLIPQYFKVTTKTIYRWIDIGQLTPYPDKNNIMRVDTTQIAQYAQRLKK